MDKLNWKLALRELDNNKLGNQPGPEESGIYLCTCIVRTYGNDGEGRIRYLKIMEYDAKKKYWHDPYRPHAISHNVLAWAETDICDVDDSDFEIIAGEPIKKK